jgi:2-oxoglutarate ferredoxin oxidoreductase subunit delta
MSRIVIDEERCKGCALCTVACPYGLVRLAKRFGSKGYRPAEYVDPGSQCTGCANCATMCPDAAITVYRRVRRTLPDEATTRPHKQPATLPQKHRCRQT